MYLIIGLNCLQLAALLPASWQSCKQFRPIISFHFPLFFQSFFSNRDFSQTKEKKRPESRKGDPDPTARGSDGTPRGNARNDRASRRRAERGPCLLQHL
jgi:hypothetical protein